MAVVRTLPMCCESRLWTVLQLVVLIGLLHEGSAQIEASIYASPQNANTGDTVTVQCAVKPILGQVTLTLDRVSFRRDITGSYQSLYDYNRASADIPGAYAGGSITGALSSDGWNYTITLPNIGLADTGTYLCAPVDILNNNIRFPPTTSITVTTPVVPTTAPPTTSITVTTPVVPTTAPVCTPNPCQNSGNCTETGSTFACTCPDGFNGTNCEIDLFNATLVNETNNNNGTDTTALTTGTASVAATEPTATSAAVAPTASAATTPSITNTPAATTTTATATTTATTTAPATTTTTAIRTTVIGDVNECNSSPCGNGGTCTDGVGNYTCLCTDCFNGTNCQNEIVNPCWDSPCKNGGTCTSSCTSYTCNCPFGWSGSTCVNETTEATEATVTTEATLTTETPNTPSPACNYINNITASANYKLNTDVTLTCSPKNPSHATYWSKDASGSPKLADGVSLALPKIGPSSRGLYYCFVSDGGCTSQAVTRVIDLTYEIQPNTTERKNVTWTEGTSRSLDCTVTSDPESSVKWRFTPAEDRTEADGNGTTVIPAVPRDLTNSTTNGSAVVNINDISEDDGGMYVCLAVFPHGVTHVVKEYSITITDHKPKGDKNNNENTVGRGGLPWWVILLIVLAILIVLGLIIFLIIYFVVLKKNRKVGHICGSDSATANDRYEKEKPETRPSESRRHADASPRPGDYSYRSPAHTKSKVQYGDEGEEDDGPAPRPLPSMPDGGRGLALQPLDVESERKKIQKKKKKKKRPAKESTEDYAEEDGGRMSDGGRYDGRGRDDEYKEYKDSYRSY